MSPSRPTSSTVNTGAFNLFCNPLMIVRLFLPPPQINHLDGLYGKCLSDIQIVSMHIAVNVAAPSSSDKCDTNSDRK